MKNSRTEKEKYQAWVDAVKSTHKEGWRCKNEWQFYSPSGSLHDLSAADLTQLQRIEREKLFLVN